MNDGDHRRRPSADVGEEAKRDAEEPRVDGSSVDADREWARNRVTSFMRAQGSDGLGGRKIFTARKNKNEEPQPQFTKKQCQTCIKISASKT